MGSFFDEEDEKVDLAAVEARHAQMEAEEELERLEQQGKQPEHLKQSERSGQIETAGGKVLGNGTAGKSTRENTQYHAEDWEAIIEAVLFTMWKYIYLLHILLNVLFK